MHFFRKPDTRERVAHLIKGGVGVREATWEYPGPIIGQDPHALAEPILHWLRDAMGRMRRPFGIDHVAVALACRDDEGNVVCSNAMGVLRPAVFYDGEGLDRITAFLDDVQAVAPASRREIVAALLSLGDIAYSLNGARAA